MNDLRSLGVVAALATMASLSAGCSGGSSAGGAPPPATVSVRGAEPPHMACNAASSGPEIAVKPTNVVALRICPVLAPSPFDQPASAITLTADDAGFTELLHALSLPDGQRSAGVMCPEYADLLQPVVAATALTALRVHLPVDGCDHALPAVRIALTAAINGTTS